MRFENKGSQNEKKAHFAIRKIATLFWLVPWLCISKMICRA
jgi:hypothetical protein